MLNHVTSITNFITSSPVASVTQFNKSKKKQLPISIFLRLLLESLTLPNLVLSKVWDIDMFK